MFWTMNVGLYLLSDAHEILPSKSRFKDDNFSRSHLTVTVLFTRHGCIHLLSRFTLSLLGNSRITRNLFQTMEHEQCTFQKFKPVAHVTEAGDWQEGERDRLHDRTFRRIRACFNVSSQRVLVQMRNFAIPKKK